MSPLLLDQNDPNAAVDMLHPALRGVPGLLGQGAQMATPDSGGVMPQAGDQDQGAPPQMLPTKRGHSLLDVLFPAAGYEGILEPDEIKKVQANALFRAGLAVMAGAHGPQGTLNFGRSLQEAFDPSHTQQMLQQAAQAKQLAMQMSVREQTMKALQGADQPRPGETPLQLKARLTRMAGQLMSNPLTVDLGHKIMETAHSVPVETLKYEKGVGPDGKAVTNVYGEDGRLIESHPAFSRTAQEQITANTQAMAQHIVARQAWENYKPLSGKYDRASIVARIPLVAKIMGTTLPEQAFNDPGVLRSLGEPGRILAELLGQAQVKAEDAATLDAAVAKAARIAAKASREENKYQGMLSTGGEMPFALYGREPWADETFDESPAGAPPAGGARPNKNWSGRPR